MIEPPEVIRVVENYVDEELRDTARYTNRTPLDSSGVWGLHQVARDIYALGVRDGASQERARSSGIRQRERDAAKAAAENGDTYA